MEEGERWNRSEGALEAQFVDTCEGDPSQSARTFGTHRGAWSKTFVPPQEVEDSVRVVRIRKGFSRFLKGSSRVLKVCSDTPKEVQDSIKQFKLVDGALFRHGFTHPILTCVSWDQCTRIMTKLHEGICGSHVGGRSLASKVIRIEYYWPTVREDWVRYAQWCKQCQQHADWHKAPPEELRSIYSSWPFHTWGIDILGPFSLAIRQMKYLIVVIEYFTKWIEVELVAQITAHKVQNFVCKNIVCRFSVPRRLVSDNGTQFASQQLGKLCTEVGIKQVFASVEHPQTNGKMESANRILLRGLKRRLEKAKGTWVKEVPRIVWAYHTMS